MRPRPDAARSSLLDLLAAAPPLEPRGRSLLLRSLPDNVVEAEASRTGSEAQNSGQSRHERGG